MSKSAMSGSVWAEMSEAQKIESVSAGRATLKEMVEGLLDGSDQLRVACRDFLANSDVCLEQIRIDDASESVPTLPGPDHDEQSGSSEESLPGETQGALMDGARKRRQGLPEGYMPRLHKH